MTSTAITRDILRGAMNKHLENDDDQAFDRVANAMKWIGIRAEAEIERRDTPVLRLIAPIRSAIAQPPNFRISADVYDQLDELSRHPFGQKYRDLAAAARKAALR
jgi:hypothetical protein